MEGKIRMLESPAKQMCLDIAKVAVGVFVAMFSMLLVFDLLVITWELFI